ncbi:MAG: alkylated DNA repair dioxygenase [Edafosvirus sp.]|uniref:Alkylated DNA repair dioxygenase n=1 Tax=Edafosvirus sp. TaxID=2487765 RepID=A0A3G4ZUB0_9VIRU|nr:MAG: alkylated DNA repair dioxygenase [Edafosvirus sp.]
MTSIMNFITGKKNYKPKVYKLKEGDSSIIYYENIPEEIAVDKKTFEKLWKLHPEEFGIVKIMGKLIKTPRWQQSYGKSYKFSGVIHDFLPIPDGYVKKLLEWVCKHSGKEYNQVLINWYEGNQHYINFHSDNEDELVKDSDIYSFSFGETRDFIIKSKKTDFKQTFSVHNNCLIIMGGQCQQFYLHSVPKRVGNTGRRINITFRLFK